MNGNRVQLHENMITFTDKNKTHTLTPDLRYFISHTSFEGKDDNDFNWNNNNEFLIDMNFNPSYGDKQSERYNIIKIYFLRAAV